jgi:hypothetical protein
VLHSDEWKEPVPMEGPINTAGAEGSPFITHEGNTFFFFFTPDVNVSANEQLLDGVTGIWWSKKVSGTWTEPERIILSDDVSLDGAPFVLDNTMWFASIRSGNYGEIEIFVISRIEDLIVDYPILLSLVIDNALFSVPQVLFLYPYLLSRFYYEKHQQRDQRFLGKL